MPSNDLILCHPILLLPSIFPSLRGFSNESVLLIRWPNYWHFSFCISPSNKYLVLISFRIDWLDLLAVQGILKSLLQHHSSKTSVLWCSAFFIVQLSHPHMTTGKTIVLTRRNFLGKVMSLLFNMLSRLVITFLPRSKCLLISWLQSPSAVILEPPQIKSDTVSTVSPSICHEVMGPHAMILVFWILSFKPTFSLSSLTFIKRLFSSSGFCCKGGVICLSEVTDISPGNLESSLCLLRFLRSFLPELGLCCCAWALGAESALLQGCRAPGLFTAVASPVSECRPAGSAVTAMGLVTPRHVASSRIRDWTCVPCIRRRVVNHYASREALDCLERSISARTPQSETYSPVVSVCYVSGHTFPAGMGPALLRRKSEPWPLDHGDVPLAGLRKERCPCSASPSHTQKL